jgi:hypothetical protein
MNYLKKHWYLVVVTLLTIGLAVMVILTSGKLSQTKQVAPTVPQQQPQAAAAACTLAFNITLTTETPTLTPTETITLTPTPEDTVTPTPTPTDTPTPTPTPTNTPTPQPQQLSSCNNTCTTNSDCQSGLVCISNSCRNPSCTNQTNCQCQVVYNNPTPTPPPSPATCSNACTLNTDCAGGLVCIGGMCRNPSCTSQTDCICNVAEAAPTPKIPVSGSGPSILGASIIGSALLILLLGLAL